MWDLIVLIPDHCLSICFEPLMYTTCRIGTVLITCLSPQNIREIYLMKRLCYSILDQVGLSC